MMMERQTSLALLADALAATLAERIGSDVSTAGLPTSLHPDAVDVLVNIAHFVADADIRLRDPAYREMQEGQMRALIGALRRGAPRQELLSYSFL